MPKSLWTPGRGAVLLALTAGLPLALTAIAEQAVPLVASQASHAGIVLIPIDLEDAPDSPAQIAEVIEETGFDEPAFPPDGWRSIDIRALEQGRGASPDWRWGRATCDLPDPARGGGAAWAVGGGRLGSMLACKEHYSEPVHVKTGLVYGPIDTRLYSGGLRVTVKYKLDQPVERSFAICSSRGGGFFNCYEISPLQTSEYVEFEADMPWAGNMAAAEFILVYEDPSPTGEHWGVLVDSVRIDGLIAEVPTPIRVPTRTSTATPRPFSGLAVLPMAMRGAEVQSLPPPITPLPSRLSVVLGSGQGADERVIDRGTVFEFGIMELCAEVSWQDLPDGSVVEWRWLFDGKELTRALLGGDVTLPTDKPFATECAEPVDLVGNPMPIPIGRFRVEASSTVLRQSAFAEAVIREHPRPGATRIPTRTPTPIPTPRPAATDWPVNCRSTILNGDFEGGWTTWNSNASFGGGLQRIIKRGVTVPFSSDITVPAYRGMWLAGLGGYVDEVDQLEQLSTLDGLPPPGEVVSATLGFFAGLVSVDVQDGNHDDALVAGFVNDANVDDNVVVAGLTEETADNGVWYEFQADITEEMTSQPGNGWLKTRLVFQSDNSTSWPTLHYLDDVALHVCGSQSPGTALAGSPGRLGNKKEVARLHFEPHQVDMRFPREGSDWATVAEGVRVRRAIERPIIRPGSDSW